MDNNSIAATATVAAAKIATLGTLAGVVLGSFGQWISSWAAAKRESDSRREARIDAAKQRRNEFEKQNLLAFQDVAHDLLTNAGAMTTYRIRQRFKGSNGPVPDAITDKCEASYHMLTKLSARVLDSNVRKECQRMKEEFLRVFGADETPESWSGTTNLEDIFEALNAAIGGRLATLESEVTELGR